jgi:hypothetical protein
MHLDGVGLFAVNLCVSLQYLLYFAILVDYPNFKALCSHSSMLLLSGETANTNVIVFTLTRSGLEPMLYHTRGEHANHYTADVVSSITTTKINKRYYFQ